MPALKLLTFGDEQEGKRARSLTTRPFASDDLQIVCVVQGVYRAVQIICIVPCWIKLLLFRLDGGVDVNVTPTWCEDSLDAATTNDENYDPFSQLENDDEVLEHISDAKVVVRTISSFLILSILYTLLDLIVSMGIWSASNVGSPTDSKSRDDIMRSLIWIKVTFINLLLACTFGAGIAFVVYGRRHNYGCGADNHGGAEVFENSVFYTLFCIALMTYLGEFLFWPCVIINQIIQAILTESRERSLMNVWHFLSKSPHRMEKEFEHEYRKTAVGMGDCLKCLQFMSCNKIRAGDIHSEVDLSDAAISFMDFFNAGSNFDIVLSDVYVAFKLINKLRKLKAFEVHRSVQLEKGTNRMLQRNNSDDLLCLHDAARYAPYSLGIYEKYQSSLKNSGNLSESATYYPDIYVSNGNSLNTTEFYSLEEFDAPNTLIAYGSFKNERSGELIATPYCILIDTNAKEIILTVRGSASLEDLVTDLQLTPVSMEDVGQVCGFNGSKFYAHRGILTRAKWIANDIKEKGVLRKLLSPSLKVDEYSPFSNYKLVLTGHSLGAACAAMLASMLKPIYHDLKCYAFCPPGCSTSLDYALECKKYVVSIVCGNDIIPRVKMTNFEAARYEFFETLARIKSSKFKAIRELRRPVKDAEIREQMKRLMYDIDDIPLTEYYKKYLSFRGAREEDIKERFPFETQLTIPGRIIHLKHSIDYDGNLAKQKYIPYWENHDSLNELTLSLSAVQEHSIVSLVMHLNEIALFYKDTHSVVVDKDMYKVESCKELRANLPDILSDVEDDVGWFMLFSLPRGLSTVPPAIFSVFAIILSMIGHNTCDILVRNVIGDLYVNSVDSSWNKVTAISLGLYDYGFDYYPEGSSSLYNMCSLHAPERNPDVYVRFTRGCAFLVVFIGLFPVGFLTTAQCMHLGDRTFKILAFCLFLSTFFESMMFFLLKSSACTNYPDKLPDNVELTGCSLDRGSALTISAIVMWFLAAVSTILILPATREK